MVFDSMEGEGGGWPHSKRLFIHPSHPVGTENYFPAEKKIPFGAEVKNAWSYYFFRPYAFMARYTGT